MSAGSQQIQALHT